MVSCAGAKQVTSGADFLRIEAGARGAALGRSYAALASDANALSWNPAGLGFLKRAEASYLRLDYLADTAYNYGALALPLRAGNGKIGLGAGIITLGAPSFDSTMGVAPPASFSDLAGILGFAYGTRRLSLGVDGKYLLRDVGGVKGTGWSFDAGVMARPGARWSLGLVGNHLGPPVRFGASKEPLPASLRLGAAWTFLETPEHAVRATVDQAVVFSSLTYRAGGGLEYTFHELFALRGGFAGDHDRRDPTAGAGLNLDVFQVDYAYLPYGKIGTTHRLSAIVRFGRPDDPGRGLRPPGQLTAEAYDKSALVTWREVYTRDVVGYHLYVRKPGWTEFRQLTKTPLNVTAVKLRKLQNGTDYEVGVTSVTASGRQSRLSRVHVVPDPGRSLQHLELVPIGLRAAQTAEGLELSWEASVGALGYHLYLLDDAGGTRKLSANLLKEPKVVLRKLSAERSYRFQVTALAKDGSESRPSLPLEVRATATAPSPVTTTPVASSAAAPASLLPPVPLRLAAGTGSAEISWDAAAGASGYNVYVSTDGGMSFRLLTPKPTTALQVRLQNLKPRTYLFAVTSVAANGQESVKAIGQPLTPR
jgi:fibronectin type 3 domain-containing protein